MAPEQESTERMPGGAREVPAILRHQEEDDDDDDDDEEVDDDDNGAIALNKKTSAVLTQYSSEEGNYQNHQARTQLSGWVGRGEEQPTLRDGSSSHVMNNNNNAVTSTTTMTPESMPSDGPKIGPLVAVQDVESDDEYVESDEDEKVQTASFSNTWKKTLQQFLFDQCRHKEALETLLQSYESSLQRRPAAAQLLLIDGKQGTGKRQLARSLQDVVQRDGGYYIAGKFDFLNKREPYPAMCAALRELYAAAWLRGKEEILRMRNAIEEAVGDEIGVLTDVIPVLGKLWDTTCGGGGGGGGDKRSHASGVSGAFQRFIFVFRLFLRAICSPSRPLVLVMEDLEYADPCSLDLFCNVISDDQNSGLVVIGTVDSTCIKCDSYLAAKLRELEDKVHVKITSVKLYPLDPDQVRDFVAEALHTDPEKAAPLAEIASRQTNGYPYCVLEFLEWLQESTLLVRDEKATTTLPQWNWNLSTIVECTQNHDNFLMNRLLRLTPETIEVLKVAACLGFHVNPTLVEYVLGHPVCQMIREALDQKVLTKDECPCGCLFVHDGYQDAAYRLIPEDRRELFHVEVGRRLWRKLAGEHLDSQMFLVLSQFNMGDRLIKREKERTAIATLCLVAGRKAAKSSAFRTAVVYLRLGIRLLGNRSWRDEYQLTVGLFNAAAEMELCAGNFEESNKLLEELLQHARNPKELIQAKVTKIYSLGSTGKQWEALELGRSVLKDLGVTFPTRFPMFHLVKELKTVKNLLNGRSDQQLLQLPEATDEDKLECMKILQLLFIYAMKIQPRMTAFLALKLMRLTLQFGLSVFSSGAFASYGMTLVIINKGQAEEAVRFAELGLKLLQRFEANEYIPRVYTLVYGIIMPWKYRMSDSLQPLLKGHQVGLLTGDFEFSSVCYSIRTSLSIEAGRQLAEIDQEWCAFQGVMTTHGQDWINSMVLPRIQLAHCLMGLFPDPLSAEIWEEKLQFCEERGMLVSAIKVRTCWMMNAFIFNDYWTAARVAPSLREFKLLPTTIELIIMSFFAGLVHLALAQRGENVARNVKAAKRIIKTYKVWGDVSPHNCLDKLFFLQAEMAAVRGEKAKAYSRYTGAIAMARDSGFLMVEALCNERAGTFLFAQGDTSGALPFFKKACALYEAWTATEKVTRLRAEVQAMYAGIGTKIEKKVT